MSQLIINGADRPSARPMFGSVTVPGDKSISHRAVMLGALAVGNSRVTGFLPSGDCLATVTCLRQLGVSIEQDNPQAPTTLVIQGRGLHGLEPSPSPLNCRRSGTTMRLLAGILSGQRFDSVLVGDPQLMRRPMRRISEPLRRMGARIEDTHGHAPLVIRGGAHLAGLDYTLPVASAQVKSAILLAGLYANGPVVVRQPGPARDHTERMLAAQVVPSRPGVSPVRYDTRVVSLQPEAVAGLRAMDRVVPGDLSSAAFIIAAALLVPGSEVMAQGIGMNPTRTGLLDVLLQMEANIDLVYHKDQGDEPVADVIIRASPLTAVEVGGDTVVRMIDEFPIFAVIATQAEGKTVVRDAVELRVKETDRIAAVVTELRKMGAAIEPQPDGFIVEGPTPLYGARVNSRGDHRLAMALAVAGMIAQGQTTIDDAECVSDSFPGFVKTMRQLGAKLYVTK